MKIKINLQIKDDEIFINEIIRHYDFCRDYIIRKTSINESLEIDKINIFYYINEDELYDKSFFILVPNDFN